MLYIGRLRCFSAICGQEAGCLTEVAAVHIDCLRQVSLYLTELGGFTLLQYVQSRADVLLACLSVFKHIECI